MFRLRSVQGKNRLRNVHTKSSSYEMFKLGYEIGVTSCGYEMSKLQNVRLRND